MWPALGVACPQAERNAMEAEDRLAGTASGPALITDSCDTADSVEAHRLEFRRFFEAHHRELARLAYLMLGDPDSADDLAAEALAAAWHRWDRIRGCDHPPAYVRRIVLNMCRSRIRSLIRERDRLPAFGVSTHETADGPDVPAMLDVRAALQRLPERKRACVILRFAFDLSEQETARALGVTVGTVKSQTSKGVAELQEALGGYSPGERRRGRARRRHTAPGMLTKVIRSENRPQGSM